MSPLDANRHDRIHYNVSMQTASFLTALVVLLGCVREAGADHSTPPATPPPIGHISETDYSVWIVGWRFGIVDRTYLGNRRSTKVYLGPRGSHSVPFTATQGTVGLYFVVAMLMILPAIVAMWCKRRWPRA